ncbi:MAG: DUF4398 domain-containing protein [Rubrivivax sp.]|nr:DUF4398 domain-containing protein [Rubrivivax sp.]
MNSAIRPTLPAALRLVAPLLCAGALAACASDPPATAALAASASSYEAARSSGASELAAAELNNARTKLERARALAQSGKNKEAVRLAEQAEADAQLARAMAASERSKRAVAEVDASLRTLREELNRASTGGGPATTTPVSPSGTPRTP